MTVTVRAVGCIHSPNVPAGTCTASSNSRVWLDFELPESSAATECPEGHMCSIPNLSFEDGLLIAGAIGGMWTLGLIARLIIRAQQQAMRD